ncbi:MAG: hypothetical protein R6U98_14925, partial [Pirellulaceae bacterium]
MESCPAQALLPLVGLAAETVIRDRYISGVRFRDSLDDGPEWFGYDLLSFRTTDSFYGDSDMVVKFSRSRCIFRARALWAAVLMAMAVNLGPPVAPLR